MSSTTTKQPNSTLGEEWLENIRCPTYFDFEAAVAYPCTVGDDNPPLKESVYDSDDETRGFFRSLDEDPSLHPTLHRRSLSPQRNRLQNMGKPLHRYRPKTTFAEYLAEFQQKQAHQVCGNVRSTMALSSTHDPSPTRDVTQRANTSNSDHTPSPPQQNVHRDTRSDAWTPPVSKNDSSTQSRRPRRSPASSALVKSEPNAIQEPLRPQAQPNPARRKPRLERSAPQAISSAVAKNGRPSKLITVRSTEVAKRQFHSDNMGNRSAHNLGSNERHNRGLKLSSAARSEPGQSPAGLEARPTENSALPDVDFVKIMEAHNQRVRIRKSERGSESTDSTCTESDKLLNGSQALEEVDTKTPENFASEASASEARTDGDTNRTELSENGSQSSMADIDTNSRIRTTKSFNARETSLSELLQIENEKVLEERKRRLPERRKVLQQNRRNALRNIRATETGDRCIKPISAQIEFTSAETRAPLRQPHDITHSNRHVTNEPNQSSEAKQGRNRGRGLRGYRSRMDGSKPMFSSDSLSDMGHQSKVYNSRRSGRAITNTDKLPLRTHMKGSETDSSAIRETEGGPTQSSHSKKQASDDLNLLLSEHNDRIRRNRTVVGAIND
ncbi:hypothetical protein FGB62_7g221 [Gracilaria domingensis]|nr:hypothetical protein FGB62_7g221 [Gracilaria domingensis]